MSGQAIIVEKFSVVSKGKSCRKQQAVKVGEERRPCMKR